MGIERIYGASGIKAVTASDTVDFGGVSQGINVSTSGNYVFIMENGSQGTLNLASGVLHPIRATRVLATGSVSTTGIVAVF
jgi:hypothetical protein